MLPVVVLFLVGCGGPGVLSTFGDAYGVKGSLRAMPHDGVDIGPAREGDPVIASADGVVEHVRSSDEAGLEVILLHRGFALDPGSGGAPHRTGYLHLRAATVQPGQRVKRGDVIGEVGLTPRSAGVVHVHWRLYTAGRPVDPLARSAGCYSASRDYAGAPLQLTWPLRC